MLPRPCPACRRLVSQTASRCGFCSAELTSTPREPRMIPARPGRAAVQAAETLSADEARRRK